MAPCITPEAATALKDFMDTATTISSLRPTLPGAILHVVDDQNNTLFTHGAGDPNPPTADSIGAIQSLSKLVGAIAYMQLVDRGFATLDDASTIEALLPEFADKKVITGVQVGENGKRIWQLEERNGDITPRMLLSHTYGGGHTYFNAVLLQYLQDQGIWEEVNEISDAYETLLASPLLYQPGAKTNYGQGLDWIAVLIERITQQDLGSYLERNIFQPLALDSMGFEAAYGGDVTSRPTNIGKFWPRKLRTNEGIIELELAEPIQVKREDAFPNKGMYHTGMLGSGLVASAADYSRLLTIFLPGNDGVDPVTGHRLLSASAVAEITKSQLPENIRNDSRNVPTSGASPIVLPGILDAPSKDPQGSFGFACGIQGADRVLDDGRPGRSEGSVYWYGAANTQYWVDKKKGIVVLVNGNYFPWNEDIWTEFVAEVEAKIYEGLVG
ncbi:Nn.00g056830.m01.CDS01 [Neocucurbitaria sp. VM-36]